MATSLPIGLRWRSSSVYILTTIAIGRFTDILIYSLTIPILPFFLHDRLNLAQNEIQSHVSVLLAVFSAATLVFSIPAGYLADLMPTRRAPYMLGLILLLVATVLFAAATDFPTLVVARILQGISTALVNAVGMAMVIDTVGSDNLGSSLGTLYSIIAVGELSAPAAGGFLYATTGYQGVFGVSMAAIALDLLMRVFLIERKVAADYQISDEHLKEHSKGEAHVHDSQPEEIQPTEEDALLPTRKRGDTDSQSSTAGYRSMAHCLRSPRLIVALGMTFLQAFIFGVYDATLAAEAESKFNFSSLEAGLLFLPLGLPNLFLAPVVGKAVDKYGTKTVTTIGFGSLVPCFAFFRVPTDQIGDFHLKVAIQCSILLLQGIFGSMISVPSIVEATHAVEDMIRHSPHMFDSKGPYGQLFGLNTLVFNAGLTVGPICGGLLREHIGYGNMYVFVAGLCAIAAVCAFVIIGRKTTMS